VSRDVGPGSSVLVTCLSSDTQKFAPLPENPERVGRAPVSQGTSRGGNPRESIETHTSTANHPKSIPDQGLEGLKRVPIKCTISSTSGPGRRTIKEGKVMKKPYEAPKVFELGTVEALTQNTPKVDKCSGTSDVAFPQILSSNFSFDCD
jgi:hypothetical protein